MNRGRRLRDTLGFDQSWYSRESKSWHVKCSRCAAICVNGIPCHEHRCPNTQAREPHIGIGLGRSGR